MKNESKYLFYLNENIPLRLVDLLSKEKIYALHTIEAGNQGATDEFQLEFATNNGLILVTHNRKDFRKLHKIWLNKGKFHNGIIVMNHAEPEILALRIKLFLKQDFPRLKPPFCISPPFI